MIIEMLGKGVSMPYASVAQIQNIATSGLALAICLLGGFSLIKLLLKKTIAVEGTAMNFNYGVLFAKFAPKIEAACRRGTIEDVWFATFELQAGLNVPPEKVAEYRQKFARKQNESKILSDEDTFSVFFGEVIYPLVSLRINEDKGYYDIPRLPQEVHRNLESIRKDCKNIIKDRRIRIEQAVEDFLHPAHSSSDDEFSIDQMVGKPKPHRKKKTKKNSR